MRRSVALLLTATATLALGPVLAAPASSVPGSVPATGGGAPPVRVAVVEDPRGDAATPAVLPRSARPYRVLADVTRVRYRTPSTRRGDLRITSTWRDLRDGSRAGVRRQVLVTRVVGRSPRDVLEVRVTTDDDEVRISNAGEPPQWFFTPERSRVERTFGPGGRMDVVLSSEWLDGRSRIRLASTAFSGRYSDRTATTRVLDAGPVGR